MPVPSGKGGCTNGRVIDLLVANLASAGGLLAVVTGSLGGGKAQSVFSQISASTSCGAGPEPAAV